MTLDQPKGERNVKRQVTPIECRDTALALAFLALLIWVASGRAFGIYAAMVILLAAMIYPGVMKYPAVVWLGLSHALGGVMSKVVLGLAFFVLVVPVAVIRRLMGKDSLKLKAWRNGADSAFVVRDHQFTKEDLFRQF